MVVLGVLKFLIIHCVALHLAMIPTVIFFILVQKFVVDMTDFEFKWVVGILILLPFYALIERFLEWLVTFS